MKRAYAGRGPGGVEVDAREGKRLAERAGRKNRPIPRNLAAAFVGVAVAALATVCATGLQPFAGPGYAALTVLVFPLPVAIGLAAGLVSPRRGMLWAPVWAGILAAIAILLVVGSVEAARLLQPAWRLGLGVLGVTLPGAVALAGEVFAQRGWARRATVVLVLAGGLVVALGHVLVSYKGRVYERSVVPQIVLEVDTSYLAIPKGVVWQCGRSATLGCYEASAVVRGHKLLALAACDGGKVLGIRYEVEGGGGPIHSLRAAQSYLAELGFRRTLLTNLSRRRGAPASWCAGVGLTRLTVGADGGVCLEPFPAFDARGKPSRHGAQTRQPS